MHGVSCIDPPYANELLLMSVYANEGSIEMSWGSLLSEIRAPYANMGLLTGIPPPGLCVQ